MVSGASERIYDLIISYSERSIIGSFGIILFCSSIALSSGDTTRSIPGISKPIYIAITGKTLFSQIFLGDFPGLGRRWQPWQLVSNSSFPFSNEALSFV